MARAKPCPAALIRRLWADRSRTLDDMAAELGYSRQCLAYRAKALGLPPRGKNYELQKRGSDAEFRAMWLAGVATEDMRQHFGYSTRQAVGQRRQQMGLPQRTRGRGKGNGRGWKETVSLAEIAERRIAEGLARTAAVTRAAMRDAEMVDPPAGQWRRAA